MKQQNISSHRSNCRGCFYEAPVKFMEFGEMPLAGGFLTNEQIENEQKVPLDVYFCPKCGLVQILDIINPEVLFSNYFYMSSVIKSLSEHFRDYSIFLQKNYLKENGAKLLEFGCNDGVLLQYLHNQPNIEAYGIDPSKNILEIAINKGFKVWNDYFCTNSANYILSEKGEFDVITGSNVFAHIDDIHEIIKAAKILLKKNGVFIVEVHYLKDLIDSFQYDTIYHEHLCYYSVTALKNIFALHDLKIIEVQHLPMHGGGIRVVSCRNTADLEEKPEVANFLEQEKTITLKELQKFGKLSVNHKFSLFQFLKELKSENKKIVGYGAPGRGTILLNYAEIDNSVLDYIVDVSPLRAGKLMPGVHIPIFLPDKARQNPPDYFLVIAWNYAQSIMEQEEVLHKKGTKFIVPFPEIKVF